MFNLTHFIWLGIAFALITVLLILSKKYHLSFNFVLNIMLVVSFLSEIVKIFNNMEPSNAGGMSLDVGSLPFHLCSMQIFFFIALKFFIKKEKTKDIMLAFMVPTLFLGGICALLIPTCGSSFIEIQPYQYFIFHISIVFFALYIIINKLCYIDFKVYLRNLLLFVIIVIFELWINSILSFSNTNFLYLTRPPMNNLPILNLNNGWYIYFVHLLMLGFLLLFLFHLPFIISNKKNKNINK